MVERARVWLGLALAFSGCATASDVDAPRMLFSTQSQVTSAPGSDTRAAAREVQAFFDVLYGAQMAYKADNGRHAVRIEDLSEAQAPEGISFTLAAGVDDKEPWYTVAALHAKAPGSTRRFSTRQDRPEVTESTGRVPLPQQ